MTYYSPHPSARPGKCEDIKNKALQAIKYFVPISFQEIAIFSKNSNKIFNYINSFEVETEDLRTFEQDAVY